jgi:hypothetical protein
VRRLNEEGKRLRVRNLLSLWKVDIVCFQETKISWFTPSLVQSLWRYPYVEWCFVAAEGASGGILLMWDCRVVSKIDMCLGSYVATCIFRNVKDGLVWAFEKEIMGGIGRAHEFMGICPSALMGISMLLSIIVRGLGVLGGGVRWMPLPISLRSKA